jgi:hypothetical protein
MKLRLQWQLIDVDTNKSIMTFGETFEVDMSGMESKLEEMFVGTTPANPPTGILNYHEDKK